MKIVPENLLRGPERGNFIHHEDVAFERQNVMLIRRL